MAFFTELEEPTIKVKYLKDLDETRLKVVENGKPTRFILRKILPYKLSLKLKNAQVAMKDGTLTPQLSFMNEDVRLSLIDIENPEVPPKYEKHLLKFKKHGDGGASDEIMEKLEAFGAVADLYQAKQHHSPKSGITEIDKKK
jgi:hypothetical protein